MGPNMPVPYFGRLPGQNSIVKPLEASTDDLLVVHTEAYLNSLKNIVNVATIAEVGGTILAAKLTNERGWAINVGGRVMIIDLDAHQGNGHEMDFADDGRVYIMDMYNPEIYPFDMTARSYIKQKVVVTGTTTDEYLKELDKALEVARGNFGPELVVYNAGTEATDILGGDPLGGLKISLDRVVQRDEKVLRFACERNVPLVMVTSGGYMKTSARVIADSIINLSKKGLIDIAIQRGRR